MRRLVSGLLVASTVIGPTASIGTGAAVSAPGIAATDAVTAPRVGFHPLRAPWWVQRAARETGDARTLTALYLADGGTPAAGRGFALVRSRAVAGAELCGAPTEGLPLRGGAFGGADVLQSGDLRVVRRARVGPGRATTVLVARGLTTEEVRGLVTDLGVVRGVLAPRSIPNDMHLAGLAPVDTTLTSGPGTVLDVVGGIASNRRVVLHAAVVHGPALLAARFFRSTSLTMTCTPDRVALVDRGDAIVTAVSTGAGDAASVAGMVRRVDPAGFTALTRSARAPGATQMARRCDGLGMRTIAGDDHGHAWAVGLPVAATGPTCVASRSGATTAPAEPAGDGVAVSIRRGETCGLVLVAGRAPAATRRVTVRAGAGRAQRAHLRAVGPPGGRETLWAALVGAAPVTEPKVTVTASDRRGTAVARLVVPAGAVTPCRAGRRI